jgi:exodeoxyribonuclease VII small subunit
MTKQAKGSAEPSFEKALAELEGLVAKMEDGGLSLEQSLAAHKRGLELARLCRERLDAAQQQVRVLEGDVLKPLLAASPDDDERDRD